LPKLAGETPALPDVRRPRHSINDQHQNGGLFGGFHHGLKFARAGVRGVEFAGQARNGIEEEKAAAAFDGISSFSGGIPLVSGSCVAPVPVRCRFCELCEFVNNFFGRFLPVAGIFGRKEARARLTDLKYETEGRLYLGTRRAG
jgi:hypothetical protein